MKGRLQLTIEPFSITRDFFVVRFYRQVNGNQENVQNETIRKNGSVQTVLSFELKPGEPIAWWDDDGTGRGYTFLDSYKNIIRFIPEPETVSAAPQYGVLDVNGWLDGNSDAWNVSSYGTMLARRLIGSKSRSMNRIKVVLGRQKCIISGQVREKKIRKYAP